MRKRILKIVVGISLLFTMMFNTMIPNYADEGIISRDDITKEEKSLISKAIAFYINGYKVDALKYVNDLKEYPCEYADTWDEIIHYWDWIEEKMVENIGVAPDGIKNPEKHAFIVLGFELNKDGTMKDELIGRLEVAKASAEKYPDSYILVTGGQETNGWTEGRRMSDWLKENGIDEERIIIEEKAKDTAGNATNSFDILYQEYDVDTVSLITSQYHLKRGSILYYAESLLRAQELGTEPITFVGEANAGWLVSGKSSESALQKNNSLSSVARVSATLLTTGSAKVTGIEVNGKMEYEQGEKLDLVVTSIDSKNYNVDVTRLAIIEGFDSHTLGEQKIKVSYTQSKTIHQSEITVSVSEPLEETIDLTKLGNLIEACESKDIDIYTKRSRDYFVDKLDEAKEVYNKEDVTKQEVVDAYRLLNKASSRLTLPENVTENKVVETNYNQDDAYKITNGTINVTDYWSSFDGPIEDTYFIINLDASSSIDTIRVYPYFEGMRYYHYDVLVSNDKQNWETLIQERSEEYCTEQGITYILPEVVDTKYIKVQGIKAVAETRVTNNSFDIVQFQAFGETMSLELAEAFDNLQTLYDATIGQYQKEHYTSDSWMEYASVMNEAKDLLKYKVASVTDVEEVIEEIKATVAELVYLEADYSVVDTMIVKASTLNKAYYKDFRAVEDAVNAVVRGKIIIEQEEVNAMAKTIEDAIAGLVYLDADYTAVNKAIAKANALNKADYKDFTTVEVAINAVVRGKTILEQDEVDAMAKAIENAITELVKKDIQLNPMVDNTKKSTALTADTTDSMTWMVLAMLSTTALVGKRIKNKKQEV